jgi:DNA repair exonuclease SbcCD ATPase subunit
MPGFIYIGVIFYSVNQENVVKRWVKLDVENIGGIDQTTVEIRPGTTVLTGRNATNRTSLLQSMMAALGSAKTPLKADAEEGRVELTIDDQTYTRTVSRQNGALVTGGNPYLDDPTTADLFAFLIESNEARRAVARADDLRDIIMRPIDTDDIESRINSLRDERDGIERELSNIQAFKQKLPELEQRRSELDSRIAEKRDELAEIEKHIDEKDGVIEGQTRKKEKLETKLRELREVRSQLQRVRNQITTQEQSIDALQDERESIETELDELDPVPDADLDELDEEVTRLRSRRAAIDESLDQLQTVIQFNQNLLDNDLGLFDDFHEDNDTTDTTVTDELLGVDDLTCWTCGSDITTDQVETMINRFQDLHSEHISERTDVDDQISSLQADQSELEERQRQREQLQSRLDQIDTEIEDCRTDLAALRDQRDDLISKVETLESDVEDVQSTEDHSELIDSHKQANELEVEIDQLESKRSDVAAEIDQLETEIDELDQLQARQNEIQNEIEGLRTKIDRIERAAIDEFNEHIETLLDILEYENLERIWLERTERQEREGRRKVTTTRFEIHVVRSTHDGTVFEDDITHLSESEREVTGLVFALAGYLAHDLHEDLPVMLIDSIEAIDPTRIGFLLEYLTDYIDYLVVALLEDDARILPDDYQYITEI